MKMLYKVLKKPSNIFLIIIPFFTINFFAQNTGYSSVSKAFENLIAPNEGVTVFRSLYIPHGGRAEAMGEAFTAMSDDISFFEYNPAASALLPKTTFAAFHNFWIADSAIDTIAFSRRHKNLGYSAALKCFYVPFTEYNIFGERASKGYYSETTATLNIAYNFLAGYNFKGIAVGTNFKTSLRIMPDYSQNLHNAIIKQSGINQGAVAFMTDIGMLLRFNGAKFYSAREPNISVGLNFRNFGVAITNLKKKIEIDDALPTSIALGVSYKPIRPLILTIDFNQPFNLQNPLKSELFNGSLGAEIKITNFFALQTGVLLRGGSPKISLGSSFEWKKMIFNVTYSLDFASSLNPLNKISLALKLDLGDEGRQNIQAQVDLLYLEGLAYYNEHNYEKAIERWTEVLILSPRFDPAKIGLSAARDSITLQNRIKEIQTLQ